MEIRFNVTGSKRKELATIISEVIGQKLVYKGMPSAAYEVADITISKDGSGELDGCLLQPLDAVIKSFDVRHRLNQAFLAVT